MDNENRTPTDSGITDYHQVHLDPTVRLSPHCTIVGDVTVDDHVSIFAGAQLRGDGAPITIGAHSNVQENCVLHVSIDSPLVLGDHVSVGHGAIVHGCTIGSNVLVGMGSIVMDNAKIPSNCLIGAGALVTQGKEFEPGSLIIGSPAKAVRIMSDEEIQRLVTSNTNEYEVIGERMLADGVMVNPPADATTWPPTA